MHHTDLHTHTTFSDGRSTMEEMVLSAIKKGLTSYGIADHCYTPYDLDYCIQKDQFPAYKAEFQRLKALYGDRIDLYLGIEWDGFCELPDRSDYDYVLGDCHYVKKDGLYLTVDGSPEEQKQHLMEHFGGDLLAYARCYFDGYVSCAEANHPDFLGHFDLLTKFGLFDETDPKYRSLALEALEASLKAVPILEMNTGAISRGYKALPYPADFLLKAVPEFGGKFILSSDSHHADNVAYKFDLCRDLLLAAGIKSTVIYEKGRFEEAAL